MIYRSKLTAFSIIESVVSLLLITITLLLIFSLVSSFSKNNFSDKAEVRIEINNIINEEKRNKVFENMDIDKSGQFYYQCIYKDTEIASNVKIVEVIAYDRSDKLFFKWEEILFVK